MAIATPFLFCLPSNILYYTTYINKQIIRTLSILLLIINFWIVTITSYANGKITHTHTHTYTQPDRHPNTTEIKKSYNINKFKNSLPFVNFFWFLYFSVRRWKRMATKIYIVHQIRVHFHHRLVHQKWSMPQKIV